MRASSFVAALMTLCATLPVHAEDWISGGVGIQIYGFTVESSGWIDYESGTFYSNGSFTATHRLNDGGAGTVAERTFDSTTTNTRDSDGFLHYRGTVSGGTIYSHCYQATLEGVPAWGDAVRYSSATLCAPPEGQVIIRDPGKPPNPEQPDMDLDYPGHTPILIALDGRYELTDVTNGVRFDIDADGVADAVAWPRSGSAAFLFCDRDGNGHPDDGGELFGNHTKLRSGAKARNGFDALSELDSDGDGTITVADARWLQLKLWRDSNHDGVATFTEIETLNENGIEALSLSYHWVGRRDPHGNLLRWQSRLSLAGAGHRPYYDVILRSASR